MLTPPGVRANPDQTPRLPRRALTKTPPEQALVRCPVNGPDVGPGPCSSPDWYLVALCIHDYRYDGRLVAFSRETPDAATFVVDAFIVSACASWIEGQTPR